ncbi:phosphoserine phosphatase RsbU/P [uncultured Gammaproteobacteria bacterium]
MDGRASRIETGPGETPPGDEGLPGIDHLRVLVVDDNRVNRQLLMALLERGGLHHIATAEDGNDGLAKLASFKPDLVLLDLMMPNMDGYEMCQRLRADPACQDLPVLVQSSLNRSEDRARAFQVGATDYVSKPINANELVSRVKIHLQNRALVGSLQMYRQRTAAELDLARAMQERLLPQPAQLDRVRETLGIDMQAVFAPSSELGGDFWDMRRDGQGRLVIWLGDFSGHGVGAALNTFRLHAILRQFDFTNFDPVAFLAAANRRLCPLLPRGQFATMLAGVIDTQTNRFIYASAGWTPPLAWAPGAAQPERGESCGLPLGMSPLASHDGRELPLGPGGRLLLYSDAAVELPINDHAVLDEAGLMEVVAGCMAETDGARFLDRLVAELSAKGSFDDDLTALVLTRSP